MTRHIAHPAFLGLAAVLLAAGCGGGSAPAQQTAVTTAGAAAAQTATVGMTDADRFAPSEVDARVGTVTLTVTNRGNTPHNLQFDTTSLGKTPTVAGKETQSLRVRFDQPGTYTFLCTFHDGMTGKVVVR